jgi:hypothetical protein
MRLATAPGQLPSLGPTTTVALPAGEQKANAESASAPGTRHDTVARLARAFDASKGVVMPLTDVDDREQSPPHE